MERRFDVNGQKLLSNGRSWRPGLALGVNLAQVSLQLLVAAALEGTHVTRVHDLSAAELHLVVRDEMLQHVEGVLLNSGASFAGS